MGRTCVVADCQSKSMAGSGLAIKVSHHEFPSDVSVRRQWIDAIRHRVRGGRERQEMWTPSDMTTVCHLHFLDTDYLEAATDCGVSTYLRRRRLKPAAVPTVFASQETNALQVLANQAVMEQAIQGTNVDNDNGNSFITSATGKTRKTYSAIPRYRRRACKPDRESFEDNPSDGDVHNGSVKPAVAKADVDDSTFTATEEIIAFVEMGSNDDVDVSSSTADTGAADESKNNDKAENDRLQAEVIVLQRKLSMAQLNVKLLEKRLETKTVKKSRAMGRSYYYEKMCSTLREEVAALKVREEEMLASNLPVLNEQAALGNVQAMFLMQQIRHFGKGDRARPQWEDAILEKCSAWLSKSHFNYRFAKRLGLVLLPSRSTLSRFTEWKATAAGTNDVEEQLIKDPDDDDDEEEEELKRQQEELRSVEMIDDSDQSKATMMPDVCGGDSTVVTCMDITTTMDALNQQFADGDSQVTIITLDPNTGVMEWRLDASTAQEVVDMTTASSVELHSVNADVT